MKKALHFIAITLFLFSACISLQSQNLALYHPNPDFANPVVPRKAPIYAGLGVVTLTGTGLMVAGLSKRQDAQDQKDIFEANPSPNAAIYAELGLSRDELQRDYKQQFQKSNLLIYSGGAVLALGAGILVNRLLWIRRIERSKSAKTGMLSPSAPNFFAFANRKEGAGFGLVAQF